MSEPGEPPDLSERPTPTLPAPCDIQGCPVLVTGSEVGTYLADHYRTYVFCTDHAAEVMFKNPAGTRRMPTAVTPPADTPPD